MNAGDFITPKVLIGAALAASAAAGGAVGYLVAVKAQEKKFQERLHDEIQQAKVLYQNMYSTPVLEAEPDSEEDAQLIVNIHTATAEHDGIPIDLVGEALSAVSHYRGIEEEEETAKKTQPEVINLFQNHTAPGDEVLAALLNDRETDKPYIITKVEFNENEPDHEQLEFTFWSGDGILVDDREELNPIDDIDRVAGEDNLLHFGYGSGDENVLYIRNETVNPPYDLCITKSSGEYGREVMGEMNEQDDHLKHSDDRKFRLHRDE